MNEYYASLWDIYSGENLSLETKYRQMREFLERICRENMQNESLQMTDLSARINFLSAKCGLDHKERNRLHSFRLTSNRILNKQVAPSEEIFLRDLRTLAFTIRKLYDENIPARLYSVLPKGNIALISSSVSSPGGGNSSGASSENPLPSLVSSFHELSPCTGRIRRIRVCFQYADEAYLYVIPSNEMVEAPVRVRYNVPQVNEEFTPIIKRLWKHAQLNLLDVSIEEGIYIPYFIVLEPDYLIDISSLAECFREYGSHPANYNLGKLLPIENTCPLLLGNIANLFLDEWVNAEGEVDYKECMKKAFRTYPIELAACEELKDREKEIRFFSDCRKHFDNIRETVRTTFRDAGYHLDRKDAVLEPSYICEALGIQGRLDYMQQNMESFIEMKSGKADEYSMRGKISPKENNKVQMLLYMAVLEYNMGKDHRKIHPYLFYTRYPLLYPASASWALVKRAIHLRNLIVAGEYGVQLHNHPRYTARILSQIHPYVLNERKLRGRFWEEYLSSPSEKFRNLFAGLSPLEQTYYLCVYNFITKELYTSKSGETEYEGRNGASSLWLSTLAEKREAGEIFYDLKIKENHASDRHKAYVTLSIPPCEDVFLPNFRIGDIVVLYERNKNEDNVTNKMVFKGNIEALSSQEIKIRLRATQQNISVFPENSLYAIEHDTMDTSFRSMYQGLYAFMTADPERRDLLLNKRLPLFDLTFADAVAQAKDDFERIALKAQAAKDYFLLVGPPGTGKTSCALRRMVEKFYEETHNQILLLAYTNRAVDEICKSLSANSPEVDFIRIGSELACDEMYRRHLIENELSLCTRRSEVEDRIKSCRVFVGTVAAITTKPELFKLKCFDVAIVDEATQILEPQLLGILCARHKDGRNAVGKFVFIGDHKQLPAVVLQSESQTRVQDKILNDIGLKNFRDSLFERLYRSRFSEKESWAIDRLYKQGRMNPSVAAFPNQTFYNGKLQSVGLPHQMEELCFPEGWGKDLWEKILNKRVAFIPSPLEKNSSSGKTNRKEARIAASLVAKLYECQNKKCEIYKTVGIITPYRSQIALIKEELEKLALPEVQEITVDTVERFQGSERDIIIYSFCINYIWQLKQLENLTEEEGIQIDRKLNVALTRARKQLFLTGVPELLQQSFLYNCLLDYMKKTGNYIYL